MTQDRRSLQAERARTFEGPTAETKWWTPAKIAVLRACVERMVGETGGYRPMASFGVRHLTDESILWPQILKSFYDHGFLYKVGTIRPQAAFNAKGLAAAQVFGLFTDAVKDRVKAAVMQTSDLGRFNYFLDKMTTRYGQGWVSGVPDESEQTHAPETRQDVNEQTTAPETLEEQTARLEVEESRLYELIGDPAFVTESAEHLANAWDTSIHHIRLEFSDLEVVKATVTGDPYWKREFDVRSERRKNPDNDTVVGVATKVLKTPLDENSRIGGKGRTLLGGRFGSLADHIDHHPALDSLHGVERIAAALDMQNASAFGRETGMPAGATVGDAWREMERVNRDAEDGPDDTTVEQDTESAEETPHTYFNGPGPQPEDMSNDGWIGDHYDGFNITVFKKMNYGDRLGAVFFRVEGDYDAGEVADLKAWFQDFLDRRGPHTSYTFPAGSVSRVLRTGNIGMAESRPTYVSMARDIAIILACVGVLFEVLFR